MLDAAEIRLLPQPLESIPDQQKISDLWSQHRVALVKQALYGDLYCAPPDQSSQTIACSSLRRTGPLGLVVDLQASFWMVHEDSAPECHRWEESVGSNPATRKADLRRTRSFPDQPLPACHRFAGQTPRSMAVRVDEVPWGNFDVVVSLDVSVPLRVIRSHPKISWIYFPTDPGTPTAKRARCRPPEGFSMSLTHTHRRFPVRPRLGPAAIECPYSFQSSFSWDQVWPPLAKREGIMVEHQTYALLNEKQRGQLAALGTIRTPRCANRAQGSQLAALFFVQQGVSLVFNHDSLPLGQWRPDLVPGERGLKGVGAFNGGRAQPRPYGEAAVGVGEGHREAFRRPASGTLGCGRSRIGGKVNPADFRMRPDHPKGNGDIKGDHHVEISPRNLIDPDGHGSGGLAGKPMTSRKGLIRETPRAPEIGLPCCRIATHAFLPAMAFRGGVLMHHPKGGLQVHNQTQRACSPQARAGNGLRRLIRGSTI